METETTFGSKKRTRGSNGPSPVLILQHLQEVFQEHENDSARIGEISNRLNEIGKERVLAQIEALPIYNPKTVRARLDAFKSGIGEEYFRLLAGGASFMRALEAFEEEKAIENRKQIKECLRGMLKDVSEEDLDMFLSGTNHLGHG